MGKRYVSTGASLDRMEALGLVTKRPPTKRALRRGPGYLSVLKERSMEFNLTLDLQHLRQEIEEMLVARELLRSRALLQRQDPAGSLAQTVRAYYEIFRQGFIIPDHNAEIALQQRTFLESVVDGGVELGNGLSGIDAMIEQGHVREKLLRTITFQLDQLRIVDADDTVVVHTQGTFQFEIQRQTVLAIAPHVAGNERIMSRLIGQEAELSTSITFYFNADSKIAKWSKDMDFASMLVTLLQDPQDVVEVLGGALIAENLMIGMKNEGGDRPESSDSVSDDSDADREIAVAAKDEALTPMSMAFILG